MLIKIADLQNNTGQIPGIPENPRTISEHAFEKLKRSLTDDPDLIKLQPLLIYDHQGQLVVVGGNMRLKAMQALGWTEFEHTTDIMPSDTPTETILARIIKHNTEYGQWDWELLGNEWDDLPLEDWGLDTTVEWDKTELPETIDEIPDGYMIDHIDRNRTNNHISNLRLVTPKQNRENIDPKVNEQHRQRMIEYNSQQSGKWWQNPETVKRRAKKLSDSWIGRELIKDCLLCGKRFSCKHNSARYCSKECRQENYFRRGVKLWTQKNTK